MPSPPSTIRANAVTTRVPWISTTATTLADIRARCWCHAQLLVLDLLIDALATEYDALIPAFDDELFHKQAQFRYGHSDNQP